MERHVLSGRALDDSPLKTLALYALREFAYDLQLPLFPDSKIEEARKQLREMFDAGYPIELTLVDATFLKE
jgi:hypothetical protein